MKYKEFVHSLEDSSLSVIASRYGFEYDSENSKAIRNRLVHVLEDKHTIQSTWRKLSDNGKQLLKHMAAAGNPLREYEARELLGGGRKAADTMQEVIGLALVFSLFAGHSQNIFLVLPEEIEDYLKEILSRESSSPEVEKSQPYGLGIQGFFQDMLTFLSYIQNEKVKITQQQELYKRYREKAETLLLEDRFQLVEYCCKLADLVRYHEGGAYIQPENIENFLSMDDGDRAKALLQMARIGCIGSYSNDWHRKAIKNFEEKLQYAYPNWIKDEGALSSSNYLDVYYVLGLVEEGLKENEYYYRLSPEGAYALGSLSTMTTIPPENDFYVQPNYEILFPYNLDLKKRWELSSFTAFEKAGQMMVARLSQDSVALGIENGREAEDILTFLKACSKNGLPQNIEYSIHEWADKHGQVYLMEAMILRIKKPQLAEEIKNIKGVAEQILYEITPQDLVVRPKGAKQILSILSKRNYAPLQEIQYPGMEKVYAENGHYYNQFPPSKLLEDYQHWSELTASSLPRSAALLQPEELLHPSKGSEIPENNMVLHPNVHDVYNLLEKAVEEQRPTDILYLKPGVRGAIDMTVHPLHLSYTRDGWSIKCRQINTRTLHEILLKDIVGIRA